ncbi:DEAD/DEAH box helicase [Arthrobacter sp. PAMC25564]|uniref:DEAD/DEAH box helicase n=1 Tax=Arthrobacter sp. PAMC25564 TaxID=2565366 RepID=UPI0010A21812|nr:DEAD/DEAH box helicase [Arthrobacter sp. PAMC25564]QCB98560.1 DEAD/DEAH box helicase [Arthrobacter sp. PAMC25564]
MVIRALDRSGDFTNEMPLLLSLARDQGLFPYIENLDTNYLPLPDLIALEMHRPDDMGKVVFHRVQAEVYRKLLSGENVLLSAPTSFGKTLVMDAIIATRRHDNIVIIVPTLALIDEIRRRLSVQFPDYKVITHPGQSNASRNLFVLTQERYLAMEEMPDVGFFFLDEFYKLNEDSERGALLNQALYRLMKTDAQFYFAAPNIGQLSEHLPTNLRTSLIITDYATVAADTIRVEATNDGERRARLKEILEEVDGPTLIYCQSPPRAGEVARWLREDAPEGGYAEGMPDAAAWVGEHFSERWTLPESLRLGVGIHHGKLPRWLGPLMVKGFDEGALKVLVCTSSLIEGVNTRAKNVIILDKNVSTKKYDWFTFANIRGRGGRMLKHFVGKVFLFNEPPPFELPDIDMPGLSQSAAASESLLLSIEEEDRTEETNERLREVTEQTYLSQETLRLNQGVNPHGQIQLAKQLKTAQRSAFRDILWETAAPSYPQLLAVFSLFWKTMPPRGVSSHGARSPEHLAMLCSKMAAAHGDIREVIANFTSRAETDKDHDKLVEDAFDFVRFWIDHNLPVFIRAVDRIAKEVLEQRGITPGNFAPYAARVEAGFQTPLFLTAEEYGIPSQVLKKLQRRLSSVQNLDQLMLGLKVLSGRNLPELTAFERRLLDDALASMATPAA